MSVFNFHGMVSSPNSYIYQSVPLQEKYNNSNDKTSASLLFSQPLNLILASIPRETPTITMKFLHLVTFCGLASSATIRPFNLTSDTVAQHGKPGNLSVVDYIPSTSQLLPRKLEEGERELSEGEKIQAFKAAKQAAGRRSLEVGKHYYFMNCYKAAADYVPTTDAGKWAAGEYKKLIQQEKKKNIHGCTHVGLVLGKVAKVAKDSSGCTGCGTVRTFDGTFRDVILKDFGNSGAYWHVRENRYAFRGSQE